MEPTQQAYLFVLGVVAGVLVTISLVNRLSPATITYPTHESGSHSLSGLVMSRSKDLWNTFTDPTIKLVTHEGLRVIASSFVPNSSSSPSFFRETTGNSEQEKTLNLTSEYLSKPVMVDHKPIHNGEPDNSDGTINTLLEKLRLMNGWVSSLAENSPVAAPITTPRVSFPTVVMFGKRAHLAATMPGTVVPPHVHLTATKVPLNTTVTLPWTPGRPGQFVKQEQLQAVVQRTMDPSESKRLTGTSQTSLLSTQLVKSVLHQRPDIKRGREKYEPELGIKAIGAGIAENSADQTLATTISGLKSQQIAILLNDPPPLIPYHEQYKFIGKLYIPSLSSVSARRQRLSTNPTSLTESAINQLAPKALPDMALQKGIFEHENLKLHLCNAVFEAYSASFLTTRNHIVSVKSESFNLSWVNCEMASFIHMRDSRTFYNNPQGSGMIMQSLDVLDFSVIHLSAFERSSRKYRAELWKSKTDQKVKWAKIDAVIAASQALEHRVSPLRTLRNITYSDEARRTVVVMPFLGGAMGAGHSELGNRFEYLKGCFWSFYEFIPNIVAGVTRQEDVTWTRENSGLPFYDIILLPKLPKSAGLPVGLTQQVKHRLVDGRYDFDYVFFTESDQILISRQLQLMYHHLQKYPHRMLLPHRLMPYSERVIAEVHKKKIDLEPNKWMAQSCCLSRQNCQERKTWKHIAHESIPVINYYGLFVPLGNVNFLTESYRGCKLGPYVNDYCP